MNMAKTLLRPYTSGSGSPIKAASSSTTSDCPEPSPSAVASLLEDPFDPTCPKAQCRAGHKVNFLTRGQGR